MNKKTILIAAVLLVLVAALVAVIYHLLCFLWEKNIRERGKGCLKKEGKLWRLKNKHCSKFVFAILFFVIFGAGLFSIGIAFDETAEKELVQYTTRYDTMVGLLNNGDFYKYGGNEIARMCAECAEWKKTVDFQNDRYGRFSSYYAIKDNVECAFVAEVKE